MYQFPVQAPAIAAHRQILCATNGQLDILLFIDIRFLGDPTQGTAWTPKWQEKTLQKLILNYLNLVQYLLSAPVFEVTYLWSVWRQMA